MQGLIGHGEIFKGTMESGLMSGSLLRNKPSQNIFEAVEYIIGDPYKNNVVLYLKGDGENNSTNIIDSSPNPKTITRFGDTKISTNQSKYGGSSIYFDGTEDYLEVLSAGFEFVYIQSIDFTFECWVFPEDLSLNRSLLDLRNGGSVGGEIRLNSSTGKVFFYPTSSSPSLESSSAVPINQWSHVAITRSSNSSNIWINGVNQGSANVPSKSVNSFLRIGWSNSSSLWIGYMDSWRLTEGIARYTTNFNPETDTYLAY